MKNCCLHRAEVLIGKLAAALAVLGWTSADGGEQPNIIIIVADDLGYGDVGCFGSSTVKTPNIDALAAKGIRLTDFHANGAVCSPTRAALLSGRYQQRTGIVGVVTAKGHRHTGMDLQETTFAEVLKAAGYQTALFGKWHLGYRPEFNPIRQGFDEFVGFVSGNVDYHAHLDQTGREDWWMQDVLTAESGYSTDLITKHGVDFIERNQDKPFLLYLPYPAPHYPYQGRADPPFYSREEGRTKKPFRPGVYEEMIAIMDEGIGRIRTAVVNAALDDQTLILFFSDNGPAGPGSAGPLRGRKGAIWEGGHRVPSVAHWPGKIPAGSVSRETFMGADILPTVAEIAATPMPKDALIDGVSMLPHLTEANPLTPRPIFWGIGGRLAIRQGDYKLVTDSNFSSPELYDLKADLGETANLAPQRPELVGELLRLLQDWHQDVNEGVNRRTG